MKHRRIIIPIYGGSLILCSDVEEYRRLFKVYAGHDAMTAPGCRGQSAMTTHEGRRTHFIGVFCGDYATLVHETGHTAFDILEHVGVEFPKGDSHEAFTYLQTWLYTECRAELIRAKPFAEI